VKGRLVLALALAVGALSGCGDDGGSPNLDARNPDGMMVDAPIDGPGEQTFTAFVIDLVDNQTADTTDAVAFATFSTLNDPDTENSAAYAVLFN